MKRFYLFATAALAAASMATAQDVAESTYTPNLTFEWAVSPVDFVGDGFASRSGIGTNGKFYAAKQNNGIFIFDKTGQVGKIPNTTTWVSINCDDAGHVYFRDDKYGWAGPEGAGWYISEDAQFCVIDSKTDQIIAENVPLNGGAKSRFDALPHIKGDITKDFVEIICPANATAQICHNFMFNGFDEPNSYEMINIEDFFSACTFPISDNDNANKIHTLASAQVYGEDVAAIYPNPQYEMTFAGNGWGNCIGAFAFSEEVYTYAFTGKYFETPSHSGVGGFHIFNYDGEDYIVYPSGQLEPGLPSADGFAVMKVNLVDAPTNVTPVPQEDIDKCVAIHFGTEGLKSGNNWRGINVEPVEGEDGKFTIYFYAAGAIMEVWTLDLSASSGINDVKPVDNAAPVYYNLQGARVNNPANGIFIEVRGDKATKIIR